MSFYFPNVDYTFIFKRKGTEDDPFLHLIDTNHVRHGAIVLREIPSHKHGVTVKDSNGNELIEVETSELSENEFRVDYSVGIVYFHESRNGEEMTIEYLGMGWVFISAARVMFMGDDDDPLESLQEMLENVSDGIDVLKQVGNIDFKGEYDPTYQYKKWNFVTYNNKTYVALQDNVGVVPTNKQYWSLVSSGVSGAGVFDSSKTYSVGDIVSDENHERLYVSLIDNNNKPLDDNTAWELILSIDGAINNLSAIVDDKINELNQLESHLQANEQQREENEIEREAKVNDTLATIQLALEDIREEEDVRVSNEQERITNETMRQNQEQQRQNNELIREQQETVRQNQELARQQNTSSALNEINQVINEFQNISDNVNQYLEDIDNVKSTAETILLNTNSRLEELNELKIVGEYNRETFYKKFNIVTYDGSSYMAVQDITQEILDDYPDEDNMLEDERYWRLIARKGRDITELNIDGIKPNDDGFISLEPLGFAKENSLSELEENLFGELNSVVGNLNNLQTSNKNSIVDAINELKVRIDNFIDLLS